MAAVVYVLCFATSLACGLLLLRAHWRTRSDLLLWSGGCFIGLALDNALLFLEFVVVPDLELSLARNLIALGSLSLLLLGLTSEA